MNLLKLDREIVKQCWRGYKTKGKKSFDRDTEGVRPHSRVKIGKKYIKSGKMYGQI